MQPAAKVSWVRRVSSEAILCRARGRGTGLLSSFGTACRARISTGYSSLAVVVRGRQRPPFSVRRETDRRHRARPALGPLQAGCGGAGGRPGPGTLVRLQGRLGAGGREAAPKASTLHTIGNFYTISPRYQCCDAHNVVNPALLHYPLASPDAPTVFIPPRITSSSCPASL